MKRSITMFSKADTVEGQGVMSATREQIRLVKSTLKNFSVTVNRKRFGDITHYHTINPEYYFSIPFAKKRGKTVASVHFLPETVEKSLNIPKPVKPIFYGYVISFYKKMDHLVVVNPYFITLLKKYGIAEENITYIPNFVSSELFFPMKEREKKAIRAKYSIPENAFVVLSAGQLQTRKGIFDFVELAKEMPEIEFIWAGGFSFGAMTDGYASIQKIMESPPKNLRFLGIVKREKMNEIYNLANVMSLLSYEELFPMTILESMNCKTPILLRDLDIYPEILKDFYLKEKDLTGFQQILKQLQTDENFYQQASLNSWRGHEFYSEDHVAMLWNEFYKKVSMNANNNQ